MRAEIFAEWLHRQGYQVARTVSSYWYEASPRVYQAFPYHWAIQPTEAELSEFLRQRPAVALRYSTPIASATGFISYHAVIEKPDYTLQGLERRTRQNVRKGLKNCVVEQISFERLATEGWLLEADTQQRQGRRSGLGAEAWSRRCLAAADLPGFEAWGALVEGRLVATLLACQVDDWCELISQQCHRDFLNARVNNALCFVVTQTMLKRPEIRAIFYTLQSLDAPPSVDEFKFRMGYAAKAVRQRVVFHPWLSPLVNRASHTALKYARWRYPANVTLAKAEGMFHFYLAGLRPVEEQCWPDCLEKYAVKSLSMEGL